MDIINSEIVVSSLFVAGFDKVDVFLYTYTLSQLSIDNRKTKLFSFEDTALSQTFNKYFDYNGIVFILKDGYSLDSNIFNREGYNLPLRKVLHVNKKLIDYLNNLDFVPIIAKKIEDIGIENIEKLEYLFSSKEKKIIFNNLSLKMILKK